MPSSLLTLLLLGSAWMPCTSAEERILVDVRMERPEHHFFQVTLTLTGFSEDRLRLAIPVWTPGSYKVRDFAQNIQKVRASSETGEALSIRKLDKSTWEVDRKGAGEVRVEYEVFAYEVSVRTSFLDTRHGYINPASVVMYVVGHLDRPIHLELHPVWNWYVDTALPAVGPTRFRARDYDHLVDSPIEIGRHRRHDFMVRGKPHRFVVFGDGNMNERAMVRDIAKIVEAAAELFGELPYERYVFITQLLEAGGGGLEHHDSTSLQAGAWRFDSERGWRSFLSLVAHEFFHLWNVKRIRDVALGPFDYAKENYTALLWVHEGWTVYYADRLLLQAGLMTPQQYRDANQSRIQGYFRRPGRRVQSLAQSSFDSWIKYYQTNENSSNATVNYYSHGALAALCFDLIIREQSQSSLSLDEVVRTLNNDFAKLGQGITPTDVREVLVMHGGERASEFWDRHIIGTEEIPFSEIMASAGLDFRAKKSPASDKKDKKPWERESDVQVELRTETRGDRLFVGTIPRDSVAWQAGFAMGDELIALGDRRITPTSWSRLLATHRPGDTVWLLINRHGELQRQALWLEPRAQNRSLVKRTDASDQAKQIFEAWSGEPFEKKKAEKPDEAEEPKTVPDGGD